MNDKVHLIAPKDLASYWPESNYACTACGHTITLCSDPSFPAMTLDELMVCDCGVKKWVAVTASPWTIN